VSGSAGQAAEPSSGEPRDDRTAPMPVLALDGFAGPLDRLLALARAHRVDLARLSLPRLVDQLVAALGGAAPLERKGDWLVMASWLVQLRSDLLVPASPAQQRAAEADAARLQGQLLALREVQALAAWLRRRPQLGREVFARGRPEPLGLLTETRHQVDVIEFLWASLALFDDDGAGADTASLYQPRRWNLHPVAEARDRILRLLAEAGEGRALSTLLPAAPMEAALPAAPMAAAPETALRRRSGWTSTFAASLDLAKQGRVTLDQDRDFSAIQVSQAPAGRKAFSG